MQRNLLVVGAREEGLGHTLAVVARSMDWMVTTAGIEAEDRPLNLGDFRTIDRVMQEDFYDTVICTAGVNLESKWDEPQANFAGTLAQSMDVNCIGPLVLLHSWLEQEITLTNRRTHSTNPYQQSPKPTFVVVSSNSAHIPRSNSTAYCASKAALSMAIRCAARDTADGWMNIWAVEPGWIEETPMSEEVLDRIGPHREPHRIPGGRTLIRVELAQFILHNIHHQFEWLHGCTLRVDGGEV